MHKPSRRPITLATVLAIAATSPMANAQTARPQDPNAPRLSVPAPQRPATPRLADDAAKRAVPPAIPRSGPATSKNQAPRKPEVAKPATPGVVTDRAGQPISGAVEVGTNRVLDPRTGQIHSTVPTASGAQVID